MDVPCTWGRLAKAWVRYAEVVCSEDNRVFSAEYCWVRLAESAAIWALSAVVCLLREFSCVTRVWLSVAIAPLAARAVVICEFRLAATPFVPLNSELTALKLVASAVERVFWLRLSVPSLLVVMPTLAREF